MHLQVHVRLAPTGGNCKERVSYFQRDLCKRSEGASEGELRLFVLQRVHLSFMLGRLANTSRPLLSPASITSIARFTTSAFKMNQAEFKVATVKAGDGKTFPKKRDQVTVHYTGRLVRRRMQRCGNLCS